VTTATQVTPRHTTDMPVTQAHITQIQIVACSSVTSLGLLTHLTVYWQSVYCLKVAPPAADTLLTIKH